MKIQGNRVLVSRLEEQKSEGFQAVQVQDSFVYKGKIENVGEGVKYEIGDVVLFSKYSPDTNEVEFESKKMKIIKTEDILAIL